MSSGFLLPVQTGLEVEYLSESDPCEGAPEPDNKRELPGRNARSSEKDKSLPGEFRDKESKMREENLTKSVTADPKKARSFGKPSSVVVPLENERLFLSHSWRNAGLQKLKENIFSALTTKGCVFWADFLDLHNEGAVEWRKEIQDAIAGCSKFVAFVDWEYLLSFSCLEEIAFALRSKKPLVLAILDQGAWDLLNAIGGANQAWSQQPSTGMPLSSYEGRGLGPDKEPFTLKILEDLFCTLNGINFCPCRELDLAHEGIEQVCERLYTFIEKNLAYTKEFAALKRKAETWEAAGKPAKLLLPEKETKEWDLWLDVAVRTGAPPQPTESQHEYVNKSVQRSRQQTRMRVMGLALVVFLILAGAVGAVAMAIHAEHQRGEANKQRNVAEEQRTLAEEQRQAADDLRIVAEEHSRVADEQRQLAEEQKAIAEAQKLEAVHKGAVASTLLLSADRSPHSTSGVRAMLYAADEAGKYGNQGVVLPALHDSLKQLLSAPYQFLDLEGHLANIHSVDFSPSASEIVTCSSDTTIMVWPITWPSTAAVPELVTHHIMPQDSDCQVAKWVSDLKIAAVDKDGGLHTWEKQADGSWSMIHKVDAHGKKGTALAVSPDGSMIATGGKDKKLGLWTFDAVSGEPISEWMNKVDDVIQALTFSPDGKTLIFDHSAKALALLDIGGSGDEQQIPKPPGDEGGAFAMSFSPGGEWLAVGSEAGNVNLLRWNNSNPAASDFRIKLPISDSSGVSSLKRVKGVTWGSDTLVIVAADDGTVSMWDLHDVDTPDEGAVLHDQFVYKTTSSGSPIPLTSVGHSGVLGGGAVAVGAEDGMLRLYFPTPSSGARGPETFPMRNSMEIVVDVLAVAWTQSGDQVAVCTREGDLGIWQRDAQSQAWEETLFVKSHGIDDGPPCRRLDWSSDGSMVAAGTDADTIEVWQQVDTQWRHLVTGSVNGKVRRHPSFSHDGRYLAVTHQGGHEIEIFEIPSSPRNDPLEPQMVIQGNEDAEVKAVAWAPPVFKSSSGDPALVLASSEEDGLHLWELKQNSSGTGLYVADLAEPNRTGNFYATQLDWSPQGMLCAMAPEGTGAVLHRKEAVDGTHTWTELAQIDGHTGILGKMSWSVDGTQLAIPFEDNTVSIFSVDEDHAHASVLWQIERRCDWLQWLHPNGEADRVACANTLGAAATSGEIYDFMMEMLMVDFEEQKELLRSITYGQLTSQDLKTLRLQELNVDGVENPNK